MSRVKASVKNAKVSFVLYLLTMVLGFFSRKVFIYYLGAEVLGLNTLIVNLLNFLNLAELGIGSAIAFALYKPLYHRDQVALNEIISVQGYLYRIVAMFIVGGSIILLFFFPLIFEKAEVPLYYAYITFGVMLFSSVLGYFVNYKQNILEADQKQYVVIYCTYGIRLVKSVLQIFAVMYMPYPYFFWLLIEFLFAIVIAIAINYSVKRSYPDLKVNVSEGRGLIRKYKEVVTRIRQLLFHKLAGFAVYQSNPIVIYSFTTLTVVAIYGNYMLIAGGVMLIVNSAFSGINASIGNLIVEDDRVKIKKVLWELLAARMLIASVLCFGILELSAPFITLWVGEEYVLDMVTVYLLVAYQFVQMIRITENFLYAYGLFKDVWAGITEAVLHIGLAIAGGYLWGLPGILSGCLAAVFVIGLIWKPIFLFRSGMKENVVPYFYVFTKNMALITISGFIAHWGIAYITTNPLIDIIDFVWYSVQVMVMYCIACCFLFYIFSQGSRDFVNRFVKLPCVHIFN